MLFNFRVPRTRPWKNYIKKLINFLQKNDATAHIASYFLKAHEHRQQLVPILDDCAKHRHHRPEDVIKVLEAYIPIIENICEGLKNNVVDLTGKLDCVWTSIFTLDVNSKALSNSMEWERANVYFLLGLSYYHLAIKIHRENRQESGVKSKSQPKEEFDPIFDEVPKTNNPQILDDKEKVKEVTKNLKMAASIWEFCGTKLYPVVIKEKPFGSTPEAFRDIPAVLSGMAAASSQEFMVQLAVQTNKSDAVISKLSMGISEKFSNLSNQLQTALPLTIFNGITPEFVMYLRMRGHLYNAISLKYYGKMVRAKEKYGQCLIYLKTGINLLKSLQFPKTKELTPTLRVIKASVNRQIESINTVYKEAKEDNDMIYHEPVPSSIDIVDKPEPKWFIKLEPYHGFIDL